MSLDRLQSFGRVRDVDVETHRVTVVVSTDDVGRDGMVIDQAGWLFDAYDRNPVVLWGHDDSQMPVARAIPSMRTLTDHDLTEVHEFDDGDPRAMDLFRKIQRGFVNATSVRWNPLQWEFRKARHDEAEEVLHFTSQELLESSYVSIPADPGALVIRATGGAVDRTLFLPELSPVEEARLETAAQLRRLADAFEGVIKQEVKA